MSILTLTTTDNGTTVETRQEDEIIVRLAENPTTGYRWHLDQLPEGLEQVQDTFILDPDPQIGSGGTREFRFRATTPGTAKLELKHWQQWEGEGSVTEHFAVEIRVTP
jgi:inhibitor of cysteine peptidase